MKEKGVTKIALILLVLVCVFAIVACSDNVNTDGVVYVSYDTYAVVTGYIGTESDVKIAAFYKDLPVIRIENKAFYDCTSLTSVTIPDSVKSIGEDAFYDCTSLTSVNITDIAAWCNISFGDFFVNPLYYAKNLYLNNNLVTALTIPDSVTSIGNYAFYDCTSLTSVTIPDSVTSIGNYAFYDCTSLTSVTIPDSVTSIGNIAFYGCTSLTSVNITDIAAWCNISFGDFFVNPLYYAKNLYLNNNLVTALTIPDSVTSIGGRAFSNCRSLTSVTIPDSVTSIGDIAFYGCTALKTVYYKGTAADWVKISIGNNNSYITNTKRYYYSESKPTGSGNYWHYVDGKPTVWPSDE